MCFLQTGRMKRTTERGQVRDAQFLLQTNHSGKSLLSQRKSDGGVRKGEACGIPPMEALLPHRGAVKCLPTGQPGLVCLCISHAVILKKTPSPFQPCSLCKQLEVTNEEVVTQ